MIKDPPTTCSIIIELCDANYLMLRSTASLMGSDAKYIRDAHDKINSAIDKIRQLTKTSENVSKTDLTNGDIT